MENVYLPGLRNALMLAFIEEARSTGNQVYLTLNARRLTDPALAQYIKDGVLTMNVAIRATPGYDVEPEFLILHSSFNGKKAQVFAYYDDVMMIVAYDETRQPRAMFHITDHHQVSIQMENINAAAFTETNPLEAVNEETPPPAKERPKLSVVK
ncbi:hypothetical protein RISINGSUN_117 [Erwinia phage vB_EamM_RisingSun]|uniref:Stringent starvation protein B n=1 Tax=Erwinia phage vB_EamM_RisingSun TaxID=2026080 RepID=A0A223LI57_9CAUD|nr:stringent starvation protein Sspb-like [Erwinia phage vB_EamM_RisingSun]ASU03553.1 hypothetical protein RISINGSUN_117 [Erwinia phage vB_EamM_RisingSun]